MQTRRVLLLGDSKIFSTALRLVLQAEAGLEVVATDLRDPEVCDKIQEAQPEVIVAPSACVASGLPMIAQLLARHPGITVVSITMEPAEINVFRSQRMAGVTRENLLAAIQGD